MTQNIKLKIEIQNPLLQRELCLLFRQMTGVHVTEENPDIVFSDEKENKKDTHIKFSSLSFPLDFVALKTLVQSTFLKKAQAEGEILMMGSQLELNRYHRALIFLPSNQEISLTEKEVAILELLYANQGGLVSKEDLLQKVWRYHAQSETHTIETHIYRLRQKLSVLLGDIDLIVTDNNGYRLNPDF